jgi:hypothetical protein
MGTTANGECLKEDRNKVYIHEGQREDSITRFQESSNPYKLNRNNSSQIERPNRTVYDRLVDLPSLNIKEPEQNSDKAIRPNPYLYEDYKLPPNKK